MGGPFQPPLSENFDFSITKPSLDLRPVCKFKFVGCGPVEKNRALYLSQFNRGGPTKLENTFFQISKLRFTTISTTFDKIQNFLRGRA